jgi:UDP-N-acetylmuramate: L-alanyl-gamma-D-glutamyl-meso-diaminopimelate ligase
LQNRDRRPEHLYLLPIGGTAMAPLAGLLSELGHRVEGVDCHLYPPMSTLLAELGVPVRIGFDPDAIPQGIDRVIIGNAVGRDNPEVAAIRARGLPYLSQPEAVAHYLLARGQDSLVVAGTHGKTTTASLLAWILDHAGTDPSYLVGGVPRFSGRSYRLGDGRWMVLEGDEYNTAFFDRGAKFLHYRPHLFILGPVEFDHADLYRDLDGVLTAFRAGASQVPRHGAVIVNASSGPALAATRDATAPVVRVGDSAQCQLRIRRIELGTEGTRAQLDWQGTPLEVTLPLAGAHNLDNAAVALAAALACGLPADGALDALAHFPGVARRLEVVGEASGVTVVDDFAHHPTALAATIAAARQRWPDRRLVVAFEPRSLTAARRAFQDAYLEALAGADLVLVADPYHRARLPPAEVLDRDSLAAALEARGVACLMPEAASDAASQLAARLVSGDVVVACSSGSFDGFHRRLLEALGS